MKYFHTYIFALLVILPGCFQTDKTNQSHSTNQFNNKSNLYVNFETSMQSKRYKHKLKNKHSAELFSFFKRIYDINSLDKKDPGDICKIPKIFHYIWFGDKLPQQYKPFLQTWLKYHPDWTFVFWVDNPQNYDLGILLKDYTFENLKEYLRNNKNTKNKVVIDVKNLRFNNRKFFDETKNYGQRSDILKWEVVYRFGGVYIDVDFECLKPLDILNHMYNFYTGIQPLDTSFLQLGAALFAAVPGHPILKHCVETIKDDWHQKMIVVSTGPLHFTKSFCSAIGAHGLKDIALPASYFYPCGYEEQKLPRKSWIKPESFAVHHWAGSWLKPEGWEKK